MAIILVGALVPAIAVVAQTGGHFESGEALREALAEAILQPPILLGSGAATQGALLLLPICAAILSPVPMVRRLRLNRSTLSPLGYVITPIGALSVSVLFGAIVALLRIHESGNLKIFAEVFRKLTPIEVAFAVLVIGVMPAFAEEFLFRGYSQTRLVQRWGRGWGISITAVLFGIMHFDLLQSPFALGFGFYIGYLAEKSGSIRPGMVCHAVNNSIQVVLGHFAQGGNQEMPRPAAAMLALIALVVLSLCVLYVHFRVNPPIADAPPGFDVPTLSMPAAVPVLALTTPDP